MYENRKLLRVVLFFSFTKMSLRIIWISGEMYEWYNGNYEKCTHPHDFGVSYDSNELAISVSDLESVPLGYFPRWKLELNSPTEKKIQMRYTMNIVWLFWSFLCLGLTCDFRRYSPWINSLKKYIAEETAARQVILISNLSPNERFESLHVDELLRKIVQNFPAIRINIESFEKPNRTWIIDSEIRPEKIIDTSETFYVVIHECRKTTRVPPSQRLIDALRKMSAFKLNSKFLFVHVSSMLSESFEDLLRYASAKQLIDFTIVEIVEKVAKSRRSIGMNYSVGIPIVHRVNPFKKTYSRINWSLSVEWFPDKVSNMWGHSLKIGVAHLEPFSRTFFNDDLIPVYAGGANIVMLQIIASKLNFSMNYLPRLDKFYGTSINKDPRVLFEALETGGIDIFAGLMPHYTESLKHSTMRTVSILLDELCPIVPIIPQTEIPFPTNFVEAYLCSFAIVTIFWCLRVAFRFERPFWQPFNILRVLFGVSATRLPMNISERALCGTLLAVSAIYSSHIYKSLTDISLRTNAEMEFRTFEDLDNSGLIPIIHTYLFNKTFLHADEESLMNIRDKCIHETVHECPEIAARFKNVTCLVRSDKTKGAVESMERSGLGKIKVAKRCFWTDSAAFPLAKGSPYRSHIDAIIRQMHSAGLIRKIYNDQKYNFSRNPNNEKKDAGLDNKQNMKALRQQLIAIAIIGYTLSVFVFIGEIIVDRILKRNGIPKKRIMRTFREKLESQVLKKIENCKEDTRGKKLCRRNGTGPAE